MPPPKNLKVLKVQPSELFPLMQNYAMSLGVRCNHCHVQGDFASDEKPQKEVARKMITMLDDINGKFMDSKVHVGCYTCHRGKTEPEVNPPAPEGIRPVPPAGQAAPPPPPPPPAR